MVFRAAIWTRRFLRQFLVFESGFDLEGIYGSFEDHSGGGVMVWEGLFGGFFYG